MEKGKKWYQSPSNWLFIVACVILIPMLLMNLSIMFQAKTNEDKVPSVFGLKPFMVLSGSMEPGIKKGDLIITRVVDPETLKIDDVIAFRDSQNTVTTHRIIDIVSRNNSNYFITKGDNNASQDQNLVSLSDVEGVFALRIPGIGSLMKSLSEPTTIVILVLGITVIFVITFMISSKKQMGKEDADYLEYKRMKKQQQEKHISVFEDNEEEEDYPIRKKEEHKSLKQYNNHYEKPFKQKNDRDYNHYSQNKNDEEEEDYLDKYMEEANKPKPYNNNPNYRERNFEYQKNKYSEKQQRNEQEEEEDILEYKKRVEQLEEEKYNRNDDFNESQKRYSNKEQRYEKDREKSFEYKKMNRQEDRRHQDRNQEFFEYKKQQVQEEKQSQYDREREEFLEYKRMKEEQRRKEQEEKEREEFQAYKRMKEEQENSKRRR